MEMTLNEFLDECGKTEGKLIYCDKYIEVIFDSLDGIKITWIKHGKQPCAWSKR